MSRAGLIPRLVRHDILRLPFASSSFDALLSFNVIYHATRLGLRSTLAEILRVLRPGSPLYLTFVGRVDKIIAFYRSEVERGVCQEIEPFTFVYVRDAFEDKYLPHHYSNEDEVRQFMSDFEIESLTSLRHEFTDEQGADRVSLHYHVQARCPVRGA
jgi:SAM-dependent methyltransferase